VGGIIKVGAKPGKTVRSPSPKISLGRTQSTASVYRSGARAVAVAGPERHSPILEEGPEHTH
jgi:hypothetical protein